jgi:hypothetical protein
MSDTKIKTSNIGNLAVTHALLHTDMDLTSKTVQVATPTSNTHPATKAYVDTEVANLIDSAPGTLDTLNELAAAINDDANFNATIASSIATKLPLAGGTLTGNLTLASTASGSSASPELELRRDITGADANYIGQIKFTADNDADQNIVFAKITGKILDASDGTEDGILEITHKKAGSNNISARFRSDSLQLINGTNLTVAGTTELTGNLTVDTNTLYVDTSNNKVGIGTANPDHLLHIGGSSNSLGTTAGDSLSNFRIQSDTSNNDSLLFTAQRLADGTTWTTAAQRIQRRVDSTLMGYMEFGHNGLDLITFGENSTEYVRIDGSGHVGIGTTVPGDANEGAGLRVHKYVDRAQYYSPAGSYAGSFGYTNNTNTKTWLSVDSGYNQTSSVSAGLFLSPFHSDANGSFAGHTIKSIRDGGALLFSRVNTATSTGTAATESEFMRISGSGNVGIGTADPNSNLHIKSTADVKLTLETDEDSDCWINLSGATSEASIGYEPATNSLRFANAADGLTSNVRMTIDASGNVGIGTTSPTAKLNVVGTSAEPGISIKSGGNGSVDPFKVTWSGGAEGSMFIVDDNGNVGINKSSPSEKLDVDGTILASNNIRANGELQANGSAAVYGSSSLGYGVFSGYRGNYNHMITSRGSVTGSRSAPTFTGAHETTFIEYCHTSSSGFFFKTSHNPTYAEICRITTGGVYHQTGTFSSSDISLKDNIEVIPNALDKVNAIRGVSYNRNDLDDNPRHVGVIAQEVEEVLPEVVEDSPDGIKQLAYGNMVALLVEAIKEQDANYKAEIAALKSRLDALEE